MIGCNTGGNIIHTSLNRPRTINKAYESGVPTGALTGYSDLKHAWTRTPWGSPAVSLFNGVDGYIVCGQYPLIEDGQTITISAWMNRRWELYRNQVIISAQLATDSGFVFQSLSTTAKDWDAGDFVLSGAGLWPGYDGPRCVVTPPFMANFTWHHFCGILGPNDAAVYIDGKLLTNKSTQTGDFNAKTGYIGYSDFDQGWNGHGSDIMIFYGKLTEDEIKILATQDPMIGGFIEDDNLYNPIAFAIPEPPVVIHSTNPFVGIAS